MNTKKLYIIASVLAFIVVVLTIATIILLQKPKQKPTKETVKESILVPFSNDFIKDFSTFTYKDSAEYNLRMKKYIEPGYYQDFRSRLLLPESSSSIPAVKKEKHSKYKSSVVSVLSETKNQATVNINYTSVGTDPPVRPNEFEMERMATIVIKKTSESKLEVTSFQFSNIRPPK